MARGKIIFLNGTSSSGKTSIAKALQQVLDEPYLHFGVDDFIMMLPDRYFCDDKQEELSMLIPQAISGTHRCIAASASAGNNIVVDHVLEQRPWLEECVDTLTDFSVLFVGIRCPLEELERRERGRNRRPGLAKWQFDHVHAHGVYDVEVDTSVHSAMQCALQIKDALQANLSSGAFRQLRGTPADRTT